MKTNLLQSSEVTISADGVSLQGNLELPDNRTDFQSAGGIVLFAHGSGSGRHSPRNRFVAEVLRQSGMGTLLLDLLSEEEEQIDSGTGHLRFDIGFLAERLLRAMQWITENSATRDLAIGLFGASTGAGAALVAAAERPELVRAVVSRGGRPDLAGDALPDVQAPTLLIVGGDDVQVIDLNREAIAQMSASTRLEIIPRATHLFEEPGALEEVSRLAAGWFQKHF